MRSGHDVSHEFGICFYLNGHISKSFTSLDSNPGPLVWQVNASPLRHYVLQRGVSYRVRQVAV